MPYWQLFYHAVWATKYRESLISEEVEPAVYDLLRGKALALGSTVFALNGMPDHVHMVVSLPPSLSVAFFIGQVKGVASTRINKSGLIGRPFFWQEEYGVLSFDAKRLPRYVGYVENQKTHHAKTSLISVLERTGDKSSGDKPSGDKSPGDKSSGDDPPGDESPG